MSREKKPRICRNFLHKYWSSFQLLEETRNLILFWYLLVLSILFGLSVPIFSELVLQEVERRAKNELSEQGEAFEDYLLRRKLSQKLETEADLKKFFNDLFSDRIPDDDVFLIAIIDGKFYGSSPQGVPEILKGDSELMQHWQELEQEEKGKYVTNNPQIEDVIYLAKPILNGTGVKGIFIVAHVTAGEIEEAKTFILIVIQVLLAAWILAMILTWIASGKILSPLRSLISTAKIISNSNLDQRLPVKGSGEMAKLATTFNEMMDRLKKAFTMQRSFINDAGHELRTPITIIRGHLELLGDDPQEKQETLALVFDELDRMSRMVEELLLLAKSEQPDFLLLESIDLDIFIQEIFIKSQTLAKRQWQLKSQAIGILKGDRHRLTQALMNLIKNATEHTQEDDLIEIGSQIQGNYLHLWVRDTGEGILEHEQQRIFERFARSEKQSRRSDGFGLGLSIVRVITEAHGGKVQLISKVDVGSTFSLIIPLK